MNSDILIRASAAESSGLITASQHREIEKVAAINWTDLLGLLPLLGTFFPALLPFMPFIQPLINWILSILKVVPNVTPVNPNGVIPDPN